MIRRTKRFKIKAWTATLLGALFFFYAFIQVNIMTVLSKQISNAFDINASGLSFLSAVYFYANILFIIPAGLLLDRYSTKSLMIIAISTASLGTLILGMANNLVFAGIGRLFCGASMSFGLISCLKLASFWFPPNKIALPSAIIITIGMLGGLLHTPMAMLVQTYGWREALFILAVFGIAIAIILLYFVKLPEGVKFSKKKANIFKSLKKTFKCSQNWFCGFFIALTNFPIAILGALFGVPYLMTVYKFSYIEAAAVTSMLFIGMIVGAPLWGWFSDYFKKRKVFMFIGALLCFSLLIILVFNFALTRYSGALLFFSIGATCSAHILGYPVINESNPPKLTGTALSLSAFIILGLGYAIGHPLIGCILNFISNGHITEGANVYTAESYNKVLIVIPIALFLAMIALFFIKETKCKTIYEE